MSETIHTPPKPNVFTVVLRALHYRNYRLFFFGQIVSLIGTWMTTTATSWLVYRLTGSALLLGIVGFSGQLPSAILLPYAGLMVDRSNRHKLLIVTQMLSMVQSLALAFLTFFHWISVPWVMALCFFQGVINAFDMPCRQSFVVEMVENKKDLGNAIALNSSMFNLARLIGPAIAGIVIAASSEAWCFLMDGVSYLAVIFALSQMIVRPPAHLKHGVVKKALHQFKEGIQYVRASYPIRSIITLIALISFVAVPYSVLMPIMAGTILSGGPHTYGFLMASAGAGALLGALSLAFRKTVRGLVRVIPRATIIFGIGLIAFSLSKMIWLSCALLVVTGFGLMVQIAAGNTILQTIVDDDKRGRVMSLFVLALAGTAPFGSLIAGSMSQRIGAPLTLLIGGACCLTGVFWFESQIPHIRKAIRPIYVQLGIIPDTA